MPALRSPAPRARAAESAPRLEYEGYHCPTDRLADHDRLRALLESLPGRLRMTPLLAPCVLRHDGPGPGDAGLSGFVVTDPSQIVVHTFPRWHLLHVAVFSRRAFDVEELLPEIAATFLPGRVEWKLRDADHELARAPGTADAFVLRHRAQVSRSLGLEVSR